MTTKTIEVLPAIVAGRETAQTLVSEVSENLTDFSLPAVTTDAEFADVGDMLKAVKEKAKAVKATKETMTKPLNAAKEAVMAFFRPAEALLEQAVNECNRVMVAYRDAQEKKRREEERKREEERRLAEQERAAAAAKAEAALEAGNVQLAATILAEADVDPDAAAAPPPAIEVPKAEGVHGRDYWYAEVVNVELLEKQYMVPDVKKLNALAQALKDPVKAPPGVRFYKQTKMVARSA